MKTKLNKIYFTGTSFTEGGGLNEFTLNAYRNEYNIKFNGNKERDVCYPTLVGKKLKVEIINDAACGGGIDRMFRKIWEYIPTQPMYVLTKTLFVLELPGTYNRLDIFSNKLNKYLICNVTFDNPNKNFFDSINMENFKVFLTENYLVPPTENKEDIKLIQESVKNWFIDCVNIDEQNKSAKHKLSGLISFFKLNNIPFLLSGQLDCVDYGIFPNIYYSNVLRVSIDDTKYDSILGFTNTNNIRISDDIKNSTDGHPGLFAHQKWADGIVELINNKYL